MKINQAVDPYNRETKKYIVAYLDILGATNRIRENKIAQDDSLNLLYNLYKHTMSLVPETGIFSKNVTSDFEEVYRLRRMEAGLAGMASPNEKRCKWHYEHGIKRRTES